MSSLLKSLLTKSAISGPFLSSLTQPRLIHTTTLNMIKLTPIYSAEPMKAKKRIDPAVLAAREARKRKKLEREIKKMERFGRKMKPIEEHESDRVVLKELELRKRSVKELSKEELDDEHFLKKEWANFVNQQQLNQMAQINRALKFQQKALKELKGDNTHLYNMAIQLDQNLVPFVREGPVHTPPTKAYEPPEGDYFDVTYLYDRR